MKNRTERTLLMAVGLSLLVIGFSWKTVVSQQSTTGNRVVFSADIEMLGDDVYSANLDGTDVQNLTNHVGSDVMPAVSPLGDKIAFVSYRDGNSEIYVMNVDGSGLVRLTYNPGFDTDPAWAPCGCQIAFVSQTIDGEGDSEIYLINTDGTNLVNITNRPARYESPAWSPNPRLAYAARVDRKYEIFVLDVSNQVYTQITHSSEDMLYNSLEWSPNGNMLAARGRDEDIYLVDLDGTSVRLTGDEITDTGSIFWVSDTQVGFTTPYPWQGLVVVNIDGSGLTVIETALPFSDIEVADATNWQWQLAGEGNPTPTPSLTATPVPPLAVITHMDLSVVITDEGNHVAEGTTVGDRFGLRLTVK